MILSFLPNGIVIGSAVAKTARLLSLFPRVATTRASIHSGGVKTDRNSAEGEIYEEHNRNADLSNYSMALTLCN